MITQTKRIQRTLIYYNIYDIHVGYLLYDIYSYNIIVTIKLLFFLFIIEQNYRYCTKIYRWTQVVGYR